MILVKSLNKSLFTRKYIHCTYSNKYFLKFSNFFLSVYIPDERLVCTDLRSRCASRCHPRICRRHSRSRAPSIHSRFWSTPCTCRLTSSCWSASSPSRPSWGTPSPSPSGTLPCGLPSSLHRFIIRVLNFLTKVITCFMHVFSLSTNGARVNERTRRGVISAAYIPFIASRRIWTPSWYSTNAIVYCSFLSISTARVKTEAAACSIVPPMMASRRAATGDLQRWIARSERGTRRTISRATVSVSMDEGLCFSNLIVLSERTW